MVPMLRYVGSKGNTTVYEWRMGFEPVKVERPEVQVVPEQPKEDTVWCCSGAQPSGERWLPAGPMPGLGS